MKRLLKRPYAPVQRTHAPVVKEDLDGGPLPDQDSDHETADEDICTQREQHAIVYATSNHGVEAERSWDLGPSAADLAHRWRLERRRERKREASRIRDEEMRNLR